MIVLGAPGIRPTFGPIAQTITQGPPIAQISPTKSIMPMFAPSMVAAAQPAQTMQATPYNLPPKCSDVCYSGSLSECVNNVCKCSYGMQCYQEALAATINQAALAPYAPPPPTQTAPLVACSAICPGQVNLLCTRTGVCSCNGTQCLQDQTGSPGMTTGTPGMTTSVQSGQSSIPGTPGMTTGAQSPGAVQATLDTSAFQTGSCDSTSYWDAPSQSCVPYCDSSSAYDPTTGACVPVTSGSPDSTSMTPDGSGGSSSTPYDASTGPILLPSIASMSTWEMIALGLLGLGVIVGGVAVYKHYRRKR